MQTLITAAQMRAADQFTIAHKPIASVDLMEKAASAFVDCFLQEEQDRGKTIAIFCGQGNNGGDGLAIARMLYGCGFRCLKVVLAVFSDRQTDDFKVNLQRLQDIGLDIYEVQESDTFQHLGAEIIIDALVGSGLTEPLQASMQHVVDAINLLQKKVYAVDLPTGFLAEGVLLESYEGIRAYKSICFQRPKLNFFFPESAKATACFEVVDIGLDEVYLQNQASDFYLTDLDDMKRILKPRKRFSHKGVYGHALLIAGETQTMGAALLNAKGCLYGGAGLTTLSIPASGLGTLNAMLPEVMYMEREAVLRHGDRYNAIGIGSGLGTSAGAYELLKGALAWKKPIVIDADALNLLAIYPELLEEISPGSVLTPHMKEFDRLFGAQDSWQERVEAARQHARKLACVIVLKNQYTFVIDTDAKVYINPSGNPGMAQGGMGDVLTGIITAYMAQGIPACDAEKAACFMHGKAGDLLADDHFNMTASQVAEQLPVVTRHIIH